MPGAAPADHWFRWLSERRAGRAGFWYDDPALTGAARSHQRPRHQRVELLLRVASGQSEGKAVGMDRDPIEGIALGQRLCAIDDRASIRHKLRKLRLAEAERGGAAGETAQHRVHPGLGREIAKLEVHPAQARGAPRSRERAHPCEDLGQRTLGQAR
jgi:hypothetical protein